MDVKSTEVDGVTTFFAEPGAVPGPVRACLVFGTGRADETLPTSGVTHAIEHLALSQLDVGDEFNGSVDLNTTRFVVTGEMAQVTQFLRTVTEMLSNLPTDRLSTELRILRVEEERAGSSLLGTDLCGRFGAAGPGLLGYSQLGLRVLTPEQVQEWADHRFTASNAALWISTPPTHDLNLADLGTGAAPVRIPHAALPTAGPVWQAANTRNVSLSFLSAVDVPGVGSGLSIARRRAFDLLRSELGISYSIGYSNAQLAASYDYFTLVADCAEESHRRVAHELNEIVSHLVDEGPTPQEMELVQQWQHRFAAEPLVDLWRINDMAERHLLGMPPYTLEQRVEVAEHLTSQDISQALASVQPSARVLGPRADDPHGIGPPPLGWVASKEWSDDRAEGEEFRPIAGRETGRVILGDAAISYAPDDDHVKTVHWQDVAVCLCWDNGARWIVGLDDVTFGLSPWAWEGGGELIAQVDTRIDRSRMLPFGPGDDVAELSNADIRWFATVLGLPERRGNRWDVTVRSDGVLLLRGWIVRGEAQNERIEQLKTGDPHDLLQTEEHGRWIPAKEITRARLHKGKLLSTSWYATLEMIDGTALRFELTTEKRRTTLAYGLRGLLGPRFVEG
jgi:hypothetical protein